jgi:hypothetical protein
MRKMRDELRGKKPNESSTISQHCADLRAWRDKIVAFYTEIAEEGMRDSGYVIPSADANGYYPVTSSGG